MSRTPRPGDFGLVSILGGTGKLIRVGQWLNGDGFSQYTHAFIYIGGGYIVEAEPGGAKKAKLSQYAKRDVFWSTDHLPLTDEQREQICAEAVRCIGTPYSFLDYVSLALLRFHIRPKLVKNYVAATHHMICSQLVDHCYAAADIDLIPWEHFEGDVTPGDLWKLLVQSQLGYVPAA